MHYELCRETRNLGMLEEGPKKGHFMHAQHLQSKASAGYLCGGVFPGALLQTDTIQQRAEAELSRSHVSFTGVHRRKQSSKQGRGGHRQELLGGEVGGDVLDGGEGLVVGREQRDGLLGGLLGGQPLQYRHGAREILHETPLWSPGARMAECSHRALQRNAEGPGTETARRGSRSLSYKVSEFIGFSSYKIPRILPYKQPQCGRWPKRYKLPSRDPN